MCWREQWMFVCVVCMGSCGGRWVVAPYPSHLSCSPGLDSLCAPFLSLNFDNEGKFCHGWSHARENVSLSPSPCSSHHHPHPASHTVTSTCSSHDHPHPAPHMITLTLLLTSSPSPCSSHCHPHPAPHIITLTLLLTLSPSPCSSHHHPHPAPHIVTSTCSSWYTLTHFCVPSSLLSPSISPSLSLLSPSLLT